MVRRVEFRRILRRVAGNGVCAVIRKDMGYSESEAYGNGLRTVYHTSSTVARYRADSTYYIVVTIHHVAIRNISFWVLRRKITRICATKIDIIRAAQERERPNVTMRKVNDITTRN